MSSETKRIGDWEWKRMGGRTGENKGWKLKSKGWRGREKTASVRKENEIHRKQMVRTANRIFLLCIVSEAVGALAVLLAGPAAGSLAAYLMTLLLAARICKRNMDFPAVRAGRISGRTGLQLAGISMCGVPVALVLNAVAGFFAGSASGGTETVCRYPLWLSILLYAAVPAIVEELVFRGMIFGAMAEADRKWAVLISSLFFGLIHFDLGAVLYGFLFGLVLAAVYLATGNILHTILIHFFFNTVNVVLSFLPGKEIPVWVVLVCLIGGLVGFPILLWKFMRKNPLPDGWLQDGMQFLDVVTGEGAVGMGICMVILISLLRVG